jgi:hypothetical protein
MCWSSSGHLLAPFALAFLLSPPDSRVKHESAHEEKKMQLSTVLTTGGCSISCQQEAIMRLEELTGTRFDRLVVVGREPNRVRASWRCRCDCGGETVATAVNLKSKHTRSCGCLMREKSSSWAKKKNTTHGHNRKGQQSRTHKSWISMKQRTTNPNYSEWKSYGGRGITVCERWLKFENFLEDMGERPEGTSLDRINVNGNYEPGTCRWATASQQQRNKRCNSK